MPKFEPIELEFVLDKKVNQDAKSLETALGGIGDTSKKSAEQLKQAIEAQKQVIRSVEKDIDSLEKKLKKTAPGRVQMELAQEAAAAKKALDEEKAALQGLESELKVTAATTEKLTTKKRKLQESLALMEMEGKRGSEAYMVMRNELALLTDALGDAQAQGRILADDYAGLRGIMTGASGIAGAFSTAAGVVGLFGKENEELSRIQTRVQSLMAITIGLQQTLNVLNKDSAFRLHTVVKAKELWGKAVTLLNTKLKISVGLSKALMVGGIGLLIAGVTALVVLYERWKKKQDEIAQKQKELNQLNLEASKESSKARIELELTMSRISKFNGTKEQEKKLVDELNSKYGEAFGQYKTLAEWYDVLKQKSGDYVQSMFLQAKVQGAINKAIELDTKAIETAQKSLDEFKETGDGMVRQSGGSSMYGGTYLAFDKAKAEQQRQQRKDAAIKAINEERDTILAEATKLQDDLDNLKNKSGLFQGGGNKSEQSKKEYDAEKELQKQLLEIRRQTAQLLFDQRQDDLQKRLDQIDREHEAELAKIAEHQRQIIERYNEANKGKEGFTPLPTDDSKLMSSVASIDPKLAKQLEEEVANLSDAYAQRKVKINREAADEINKIMQGVADSFISEQEREIKAVQDKYNRLRQELIKYQGEITAEQEKVISDAQQKEENKINDEWFFKTNDAFVKLFGNIDRESTKALEKAIETAKRIVDEKKDSLSATDLKSYTEAIAKAENELRQRNPFKGLMQAIKDYQAAADDAAKKDTARRIFESASASLDIIKGTLDQVMSSLDELGFLSEDQKKTYSQVSGMMQGAGNVAQGIATNNPLQIIQGSIGLITNAIGLFDQRNKRINREIEKTQKKLKALSREYKELERATREALGTDVFKSQVDEVKNLEKQVELNKKLIRLEQSKKKKKRDQNKIEGWKDDIQNITNEIEDIYQEIFESIVQTNAKSLADELASKLVEAFQAGEDAAKSFEEISSQVLQNAVKNALKLQLLEQPIQNALKGLKAKMGSEINGVFQYDGLTEEEAESFKAEIAAIGSAYANALKDLSYIFDEIEKPDSSLTGAIKGVSEETASALGGQITAIRITQAETQSLIRQQLFHMAEIAMNTRQAYRLLAEIRDVVKDNETDPLRSKGL